MIAFCQHEYPYPRGETCCSFQGTNAKRTPSFFGKTQKNNSKTPRVCGAPEFFFWRPVLVPFFWCTNTFFCVWGGPLKAKHALVAMCFFSQGAGHVLLIGAPKKRVSGKTQTRIAKRTELLQFCIFPPLFGTPFCGGQILLFFGAGRSL